MSRRERVLVAMSGGVDSSLAAALVVREGVEAIGITLHLAGGGSRCCSLSDVDDARQVADSLGIHFYVANETERFAREVMEPFADDYLAGRTPIPCVSCNKRFKFDGLLKRADVFGATRLATGHFARTHYDSASESWKLLRARDRAKDQSYFLFQLSQEQLARCWFPLGGCTKHEVRELARSIGLATADKPESNEICFVPEGHYAQVVERLRPAASERSGDIVNESGRVLGRHQGIHRFTVGQRKGLGLSSARPLYVTRLEAGTRRVVVGEVEALGVRRAALSRTSWIASVRPDRALRAEVQVRHRHPGAKATIIPTGNGDAIIDFDQEVRAVAAGQAAVFYDGDEVLGGGWIEGTGS